MAEKPFLKLSSKDFLSGISPAGAHGVSSGLFFKADGVTPLFEAGTAQSVNNGLLMAGASPVSIAGTPNGNFISSAQYTSNSATTLYFGTSTGHIFTLTLDSTLSGTLTDANTATNLRQGMETFYSSNGSAVLFYFMDTAIGRTNLSGSYDNAWKTSGISNDDIHASHWAFDSIWFGNAGNIGRLFDDGLALATSSGSNTNTSAFAIARFGRATDISDDGLYLVIATSRNSRLDTNAMSGSNIIFWDTFSTLPTRVYEIPDPFIYALEKTPLGVFAYGVTGIWQVAIGAEPHKVFSHSTGIYSAAGAGALQYGRPAASHYGDALVWGGSSGSNYAIKSLGKLDSSAPSAYLHPFLTTAGKNITFVNGQLAKGYVIVGDDAPSLKGYPFSGTPNTGVTAQTAYISLPSKTNVKRVDLVFGEPLVSGDSVSFGIFRDQDTAVTTLGTASFANDGAIRRKSIYAPVICEEQMSALVTYTAGAVKLKDIEFYGDEMTP